MTAHKRKLWDDFAIDEDELESIHKMITNNCYWSESDNLFGNVLGDHDYCAQPNHTNATISEIRQNCAGIAEKSSTIPIADLNLEDLDVQNCIEVEYAEEVESTAEIQSAKKSNVAVDEIQNDLSIDLQNTRVEQITLETRNNKLSDSTIVHEVQSSVREKASPRFEIDLQNCIVLASRDGAVSEFDTDNVPNRVKIDYDESGKSIIIDCDFDKTVSDENRRSLSSLLTDDSGIDSMLDSSTFENECSRSSFASTFDFPQNDHGYCSIETHENARRLSTLTVDSMEISTEAWNNIDITSLKKEKPRSKKKITRSREVLVSEESPVIEGEFEESRRVTRQLLKTNVETPVIKRKMDNVPGKLVWGYFRMAWWPALIIKAEDAGMIYTSGKIWVAWIGESRISELAEKYVEPFSWDFETRLDSLTTTSKQKITYKKQKDDACFATIQLLKVHFNGGALIRPYSSWIKTNISPHKDSLDDITFYPYPDHLAKKLEDLKKANFTKSEKYLRKIEKERLNKEVETKTAPKKVEKIEKPIDKGGINIMDQKPGMIVWAKIPGYSLWPCVIMDYQHLNKRQPSVANQWVMWYGDFKISEVDYHEILTFPMGIAKLETKINNTKDDLFVTAVLQSTRDYCERLESTTKNLKREDVTRLFLKSRDKQKLTNGALFEPDPENPYPQGMKKQLRFRAGCEPMDAERKRLILQNKKLKSILSGDLPFDSICMTCLQSDGKLEEHPFFHASLCTQCLEEFRPKVFAYGNDGKCFYCTLCGDEDSIAMCDNLCCPRVFCIACINHIICPNTCKEVLLKHPWNCFVCEPDAPEIEDSLLKMRDDWRNRLVSLYRINCDDESSSILERFDSNRKIRVLSLFDGIGTGLVVLKRLNINVECYYASEIDPDSMQVSFFNHGDEIIQLGDVRNIDEEKIKEIGPFDLLIGGSPCNELSLANPKRRGLDDPDGTGVLFYDYVRIKKLVEKYNKKRHLFWLFENVASMPKKFRNQISQNLGREPHFLDSADFSAQHRPRLYWGNLPWGPYEVNDVVLQDVLRKNCNRQALVKKIMTVTTRTNSLNQTKQNLKPVLMNGKFDSLWVTELEGIFGFPVHYTDANLQKTRRLQLIGKAWSVQTLMALLRSMFYF